MHLLKRMRLKSSGAFVAFAWIVIMQGSSHAQQACEDLKKLTLDHVTITSAAAVEAAPLKQSAETPFKLPEGMVPRHCEVAGVARPTSDSEISFLYGFPPPACGMANTCSAATPGRLGRLDSCRLRCIVP